MTEYEFTINLEPTVYIHVSSNSKTLLNDIENAVNKVIKETFPKLEE